MKGASLLARIQRPELAAARRHAPENEIRESVLGHLQNICATRLGSMLVRGDFGLPSVSDMVHSFPEGITEMARAMRHTIEIYEPRLKNVRVMHVPDETNLIVRYEISAQLVSDAGTSAIKFESVLASGRMTIR